MAVFTRGFGGRAREQDDRLPPGQFLTEDFPVLSAGPTPRIDTDEWEFQIRTETGETHRWDWAAMQALQQDDITRDIHCVTRWTKLGTSWQGVSLDTLSTSAKSATGFDGEPLAAEHGGPARLLIPHLYFWKSAKWIRGLVMQQDDEPGFWEQNGYHAYGDPWLEQRYS
jgi:DMSO/TMAO reductase YedYZ molybdopterin-dependent catalytic subunit